MPTLVQAVPPIMPKVIPEGTVVGRHRIDGLLREGGMATIYLGHHVETQARVAIKLLHTEYVHQPDFVARFDREAHVMGRLSGCPQIVSVRDVGSLPDGRRYLVMDFVRGHDLRDELEQLRTDDTPMDPGRAVSLMRDVAAGLAVAHHMQVVHRDIKPSNIMLEQSAGRELAKLVDFGISADLAATGPLQDLTAGGTIIGTARYMSPEQAAGISNVATVDIWAMGVVLVEMLTGITPPEKGWGLRGVDLSRLPPVPDELRTLIQDMLEPDSTRRLQSASEVERRLLGVLPQLSPGVSLVAPVDPALHAQRVRYPAAHPSAAPNDPTSVVTPPRSPATGRAASPSALVPILGGVLGALLLASAAGAWWWWGPSTDPQSPTDAAVADASESPEPGPPSQPSPSPTSPAPAEPAAAGSEPQPQAPEPEPQAPEPDTKVERPRPKAGSQPRPKSKPSQPSTPKPTPQPGPPAKRPVAKTCDAQVHAAEAATEAKRWADVLSNTRRKSCWTGKASRRQRLRVRAYLQLGNHAQCIKEGRGSGDPIVLSMVSRCRDGA